MKKLIITLISLLSCVSYVYSQTKEVAIDPKGKAILDKASAQFSNHKGLTATLAIQVINNQNDKKSNVSGSLMVKGSKFKLCLPDVTTYYDGQTEYVHLIKEKEVNISTPKADDLKEVNPIFLLQSYKKGYKIRYDGAKKVNGKNVDVVNLYPNDRSKPFSIITIAIDKTTLLPVYVKSKGKNGIDTVVNVQNISDKNLNDSVFIFDTKSNKDVEVIDLR